MPKRSEMLSDPPWPPRELAGYGASPPDPKWPGGAKLALQFVINIEEGAEAHIFDGDSHAESLNSDVTGAASWQGRRNLVIESHYEYGSRVGIWRLLDLFAEHRVPLTAFAVGLALERTPDIARRLVVDGHEIAAHGWRWIDYGGVPPEVEAEHMRMTITVIERLAGKRPLGWYTGRISMATRRLVIEEGGFLYDSDAYNDDLPYWVSLDGRDHLVIPYAFDTNDMRFASAPGFDTGADYLGYLRDSFDWLYAESARKPRLMSVGLHPRLAGRPGRTLALARFLDHVARHPDVWVCRRVDLARHWIANFSPTGRANTSHT